MKPTAWLFGMLVAWSLPAASTPTAATDSPFPSIPVTRASARAIRYLKAQPASAIEKQLPAVPFEPWLVETLGPDFKTSWDVGTCNTVLPRVLADSLMCVELVATRRAPPGEIRLFVDVGTFGGLRAPRLESGSFWRSGVSHRESGWVGDLGQLADLRDLLRDDAPPADSTAIVAVRGPRSQLALVRRVEELPASSLDATLPEVGLAPWLRQAVPPDVELEWRVSDCDLKDEEAVCVRIDARRRGAWAKIHVETGTYEASWSGHPEALPNALASCEPRVSAAIEGLADFARVFARPGWDRCE